MGMNGDGGFNNDVCINIINIIIVILLFYDFIYILTQKPKPKQ
jgi:hypothetical protein